MTEEPEQVIVHELHQANHYIRELAALNRFSVTIRLTAISLLEADSLSVLERIITAEAGTEIGIAANQQQQQLIEKVNSSVFQRIKATLSS